MSTTMMPCVEALEDKLRGLEVEYLNSYTRIVFTSSIPQLSLSGEVLRDIKEGTQLQVRRWVAETLMESRLATPATSTFDTLQLRQLEWKERNYPSELQELPPHFYREAKRTISEKLRQGQSDLNDFKSTLTDIISLRLSKILNIAARPAGDVLKRLSSEEKVLYDMVGTLVSSWTEKITPERKAESD